MNQKHSVSIVTSMYNATPATLDVIKHLFLPSVLNNVNSDYQLILIDDVSPLRKQTRLVIEQFKEELRSSLGDFQYIESTENVGFSGSYNKGMKLAEGDIILMTNDDVYFPQGSIQRLAEPLKDYSFFGTVAPITDFAYSYQNTKFFPQIQNYSAEELQRIEEFDATLRAQFSGQTTTVPFYDIIGFCQSFKKSDLEKLDYFDTTYKFGNFEDKDLNKRVEDAGGEIIILVDTFVKHGGPNGGSVSVKQNKLVEKTYLKANRKIFEQKFGSDLTAKMIERNADQFVNGHNTIDSHIYSAFKSD